ncbi:hypothetical protein ABTE92_18875, partial [Acinetobacter baumannii]
MAMMTRVWAAAVAVVFGALAVSAAEAQEIKQIKLTETQISGFVAAQKDLAAISSKIQAAGEKPDAALQAELDGIAKKNGFASFSELDDV